MEHTSIIGLDIAKNVFQVHRTDASGAVLECRRLRRGALLAYFAQAPRSLVGLEACASAHHWGRALALLGHQVRLIAPSYVKPYVQRQKNDAADAAAIAEAVTRPHMRFVPLKSVPQQGVLMLHRVRALLIRQRTMAINAMRAHLAELGIVSARGRSGATALVALIESDHEESPLDELARAALTSLVAQLRCQQDEIAALERRIMAWHKNNEASLRLATIPGIGYLTASALAATLGDGSAFGSARQLAAWIGLVPRQNSSGGKTKLGRITKQGDSYLRRLLVTGATAALKHAKANAQSGRHGPYPWAEAMLANKPYRLVTVALANKMARIVWAVLTSGQPYRRHAPDARPAADAGLQASAG